MDWKSEDLGQIGPQYAGDMTGYTGYPQAAAGDTIDGEMVLERLRLPEGGVFYRMADGTFHYGPGIYWAYKMPYWTD